MIAKTIFLCPANYRRITINDSSWESDSSMPSKPQTDNQNDKTPVYRPSSRENDPGYQKAVKREKIKTIAILIVIISVIVSALLSVFVVLPLSQNTPDNPLFPKDGTLTQIVTAPFWIAVVCGLVFFVGAWFYEYAVQISIACLGLGTFYFVAKLFANLQLGHEAMFTNMDLSIGFAMLVSIGVLVYRYIRYGYRGFFF